MQIEFSTAINRIIDDGPNPSEFMLSLAPNAISVEAVDRLLEAWATAYSHRLREPDRRSPIEMLSKAELFQRLVHLLSRDIVFNTRGFEDAEANELAQVLVDQLSVIDAAETTFPIRDWTMSHVVVIRGDRHALLLAFLGED